MQRRYFMSERALTPGDYDIPVGWWGWNWEPPVPMSITEIVRAGNMDTRTASVLGLAMESHASLIIAAEQPHSGKTTTLTALLDYLPQRTRRVFLRGWGETFDYLEQTRPHDTILLANELSSHLPVYLWGGKAIRVFQTLERGYAFGSTMHADSAEEAVSQISDELGVPPHDLARVQLLMVMRIYFDTAGRRARTNGGRGTMFGAQVRRVVTLHRLLLRDDAVVLVPLVTHDLANDAHAHETSAEAELIASLRHETLESASGEIARRAALLDRLVAQDITDIARVRAALAADRGETAPRTIRGDPTE